MGLVHITPAWVVLPQGTNSLCINTNNFIIVNTGAHLNNCYLIYSLGVILISHWIPN